MPKHPVGRASDASRPQVEDMRVDHRGTDVTVTEELLDGPDVVVILEQVGREGVSEGVARGELGNARGMDGVLHGALENGFVEVMAATLASETVHVEPCGWEDPLPRPVAPGMRGTSAGGLQVARPTRPRAGDRLRVGPAPGRCVARATS
jgi:hypothetical protein